MVLAGRPGNLDESAAKPPIALGGPAAPPLAGALVVSRAESSPRRQMKSGSDLRRAQRQAQMWAEIRFHTALAERTPHIGPGNRAGILRLAPWDSYSERIPRIGPGNTARMLRLPPGTSYSERIPRIGPGDMAGTRRVPVGTAIVPESSHGRHSIVTPDGTASSETSIP